MAVAATTSASIRLSDGRLLRYFLWKVPGAAPVGNMLHFHGWPSSAEEGGFLAQAANEMGLNMACFDRPGVGGSSLNPGLSFQSIVDDAHQLLHHLDWASSPVLLCGASGGGPYAAACAALLSNKPTINVAGLVLYASMTHTTGPGADSALLQGMDWGNRLGYAAINYLPLHTRIALGIGAAATKHVVLPVAKPFLPSSPAKDIAPEPFAPQHAQHTGSGLQHDIRRRTMSGGDQEHDVHTARAGAGAKVPLWRAAAWSFATFGMAAADRKALWDHGGGAFPQLIAMMRAVFNAPGYGQGLWQDMRLTTQPWDFQLDSIKVPTLVYQGTADVNVTVGMAKHLAQHIPGAHLPSLRALQPSAKQHKPSESAETGVQMDPGSAPAGLILMPGEGHMSLGLNHGQGIMRGAVGLLRLSHQHG